MSEPTISMTIYAAKLRDGTFRCVEAVSWKDAKRHLGSAAVSIKKRAISIADYHVMMFDDASRRDIHELGFIRRGRSPVAPGKLLPEPPEPPEPRVREA